jgi:hypothetical protein
MNRSDIDRRHRDRGLTFVELIVTTVLLALVTTVIAASVSAVLRTTAPAQYRIDDARSVRGLQTWLIRDVASAPIEEMGAAADVDPGGYQFDNPLPAWAEDCGASGANLVHMTWVDAATSVSYHANYTLDGNTVYRTTCSSVAPTGRTLRLTGDISSTLCASASFVAHTHKDLDGDSSADEVSSIELCLRSFEADSGLNAGGGDTQEIRISVSSRNYPEPPL